MSASLQELKEPAESQIADAGPKALATADAKRSARLPVSKWLAIPAATAVAYGVHLWAATNQLPPEAQTYSEFLEFLFGIGIVLAAVQPLWSWLRRWMDHNCPILAGAICLLCVWEVITSGLHWLPMPYFPSPAGVLQSMLNDHALLFDSTWHSLVLLLNGYALGVAAALVTGVCIGWFAPARYWGKPWLPLDSSFLPDQHPVTHLEQHRHDG